MIEHAHPEWWTLAACHGQGPERWTAEGQGSLCKVERLRDICARCPTSGECLRDALRLPPMLRHDGPVRVGISGPRLWRDVERIVTAYDPTTADDWSIVAAMLLDFYLAPQRNEGRSA